MKNFYEWATWWYGLTRGGFMDCREGDLCGDMVADPNFPKQSDDFEEIDAYLARRACSEAYETFLSMWEGYGEWRTNTEEG